MKRIFDVTMSVLALIVLSPLLGLTALLVLLDDGRPVIYRQTRVGRSNELFQIRKFRTMRRDTECLAQSDMQGRDDCYTRTGRLLRTLSLDELPQLLNIVEGTMSFVGPRPLIPAETAIRDKRAAAHIYDVLPGMTGWAQVNGRANVSDDDKVALDAEYLAKKSVWLDIRILFMTAWQVIRRKDVG